MSGLENTTICGGLLSVGTAGIAIKVAHWVHSQANNQHILNSPGCEWFQMPVLMRNQIVCTALKPAINLLVSVLADDSSSWADLALDR
jgi:hypothetical protein